MKIVLGKEAATVLIVLLMSIPAVFSLAPEPPRIFLGAEPQSQDVEAGGSTTFKVVVYPQGSWKSGDVVLTPVNPPQGVTVTLSPEKMNDVQLDGFTSDVTVKVAAGTPQGKVSLQIQGTGIGYSTQGGKPENLNSSAIIALNIVAASAGKTTTTTTNTTTTTRTTITTTNSSATAGSTATVTSFVTSTLTTTSISTVTIISTERAQSQSTASAGATGLNPATNGYMMFGVGALAVSSVLFVSGVLLLAANRKHH